MTGGLSDGMLRRQNGMGRIAVSHTEPRRMHSRFFKISTDVLLFWRYILFRGLFLVKKKCAFVSLAFFLIFLLTGCSGGSYVISVGEIEAKKDCIKGDYHSFSGKFFKKVTVDDGETLSVHFHAETEQGTLIAKIIDSNGKTIQTLVPDHSFRLKKPGKYKFQVEGEKHKGNFNLAWKTGNR